MLKLNETHVYVYNQLQDRVGTPISGSFLVSHKIDHRNKINGCDSKELGIVEHCDEQEEETFLEVATHSSTLAWRIPGMVEPGGLLSMGWHRVGHDWSDLAAAAAWKRNVLDAMLHLDPENGYQQRHLRVEAGWGDNESHLLFFSEGWRCN